MVPLVYYRGHGVGVRLESVINLSDAYRGAVKLVGIIFDLVGHQMVSVVGFVATIVGVVLRQPG